MRSRWLASEARERWGTIAISRFAFAVGLALAVAAVIRLWDIGSIPLELHPDEMAPYVGMRDMLTGARPVSAFIDANVIYLPLYGIFELVSAAFFGQTPTAMRVPAALLGVATALGTGLLAYALRRDRRVLLAACATMAVLPWDVSITRIGWEPAGTLAFLTFGLAFSAFALEAGDRRMLLAGAAILGVGAYTYRAELFDAVTMWIVLVAVEHRRARAHVRDLLSAVALFLMLLLPLITSAVLHPKYLSDGPAQLTFAPGIDAASLHTFAARYLAAFSPLALFVTGDGNLQHGPACGVLYAWMLPFIVVGLVAPGALATRSRAVIVAWLALYPVGSALINEAASLQSFVRALSGAVLFTILASAGLVWSFDRFRRRVRSQTVRGVVFSAAALVVAVSAVAFARTYFITYPDASAPIFQYGNRALFAFARAHVPPYRRVCFTAVGGWNWIALTRYYLPDAPFDVHARIEDGCRLPGTLYGLQHPDDGPRDAKIVGTIENRDGTIFATFTARP